MRAVLVGAMLVFASSARADHLGVLQLNGDPVGPYAVSVWTQPGPVRVGACVVTVAVMRPGTRIAVTDAIVRVTARRVTAQRTEEPHTSVSAEGNRSADPLGLRYIADVPLPAAGHWTVVVAIRGPAGAGNVEFPLDVTAPIPWGGWALAAGVVGLLSWWAARESRRRSGTA
jgi:hypothetical protein